jgi:F-type H+-transporting ATPase subunit delta
MSGYRVDSRYSKSVFDLAIELKQVDRVYQDMLQIEQVCLQNPSLVRLLKNPIIRYDSKLKVLTRVFHKHVSELTLKFFGLLCRKNRADVLPDVSKVFVDLYNEHKGIVRADVSSAVTLSPDIQQEFEDIVARATGKKVDLKNKVDPSLIGGYVLKIGDKMINDSIKHKLYKLRRELKSHP